MLPRLKKKRKNNYILIKTNKTNNNLIVWSLFQQTSKQ